MKADELDRQHILVNYDARNRDQWLAVDRLADAVRRLSTIEGERSFEVAPNNWLVIHFDYGACADESQPFIATSTGGSPDGAANPGK